MFLTNFKTLTSSADSPIANTLISAMAMANGVKTYSQPIKVEKNVGFFSALLTEAHSGASGDVDVYMEYSWDGTNWYRPNTTSGGALTQESDVVTTLSNATKWIVVTARLATWARVVFDPDADSVVTAGLGFQEET